MTNDEGRGTNDEGRAVWARNFGKVDCSDNHLFLVYVM